MIMPTDDETIIAILNQELRELEGGIEVVGKPGNYRLRWDRDYDEYSIRVILIDDLKPDSLLVLSSRVIPYDYLEIPDAYESEYESESDVGDSEYLPTDTESETDMSMTETEDDVE